MSFTERRQFPRVESSNLTYVYRDKGNQILDRGTGRTINISQWGFLFESNIQMKKKHNLIATVELPDGPVELQGTIVYSKRNGDKYIAGVEIKDMAETDKPLWEKLIGWLLNKKAAA